MATSGHSNCGVPHWRADIGQQRFPLDAINMAQPYDFLLARNLLRLFLFLQIRFLIFVNRV